MKKLFSLLSIAMAAVILNTTPAFSEEVPLGQENIISSEAYNVLMQNFLADNNLGHMISANLQSIQSKGYKINSARVETTHEQKILKFKTLKVRFIKDNSLMMELSVQYSELLIKEKSSVAPLGVSAKWYKVMSLLGKPSVQ